MLEKYLEGIEAALMKYSERDIEENWCLVRDIYISAPKEFPLDLRHYRKPDPTYYKRCETEPSKAAKSEKRDIDHQELHSQAYVPRRRGAPLPSYLY